MSGCMIFNQKCNIILLFHTISYISQPLFGISLVIERGRWPFCQRHWHFARVQQLLGIRLSVHGSFQLHRRPAWSISGSEKSGGSAAPHPLIRGHLEGQRTFKCRVQIWRLAEKIHSFMRQIRITKCTQALLTGEGRGWGNTWFTEMLTEGQRW